LLAHILFPYLLTFLHTHLGSSHPTLSLWSLNFNSSIQRRRFMLVSQDDPTLILDCWIGGESHLTVNDLILEGIQALVSAIRFTHISRPLSQQKCESQFRPMKRLQRGFNDSDDSPVSHDSVPKFDVGSLFELTP
jgi:hypothetical protein